jgi:hypothetical protein
MSIAQQGIAPAASKIKTAQPTADPQVGLERKAA